jgi:GT2 family glycosyltransferase
MGRVPAVSILLPCRNGGPHLDEALDSVAHQTFGDFEVIAVDDGSTDDTHALLLDRARRDGRVKVIRSPARGLVPALATGLAAARGPLVARMDADDVAHPRRLEEQVRLLDDAHDLVACGTAVRYFPRHIVRDGARRYEAWVNGLTAHEQIARDMFIECPIPHPTLMLRRNALVAVGGYRDMGWPEDYDLVLRLWAAGCRMQKLPEVLYHWREGPGRASRVDPRYAPDRFRQVKVHFLRRTLLADGRPAVVWGAGPVGKRFARDLAAAGTPVAAFIDLDPRKIGQEIHGAPVVEPHQVTTLAGHAAAMPKRALVLATVGQAGAREEIRAECRRLGLVEIEDFIAVA